MNVNLFLSILAMDAYNRSPNNPSGLAVQGPIGNATLIAASSPNSVGFFAQAYDWQGTTVISYRGTDQVFVGGTWQLDPDVVNGWTTGAGIYDSAQAKLAAQFYQQINGGTDSNSNMILTGHSLGGGLAGFLGSIYGTAAIMFDNMPFERAANQLFAAARPYDHYDPASGAFIGNYADDEGARSLFYQSSNPATPTTNGIGGYDVQGEPLHYLRLLQNTPLVTLPTASSLSLGQLHSQSLLVILLYGDPNAGGIVDQSWTAFRWTLSPKLFDNSLAEKLGISGADPADLMRTMIAYSAIDEGTLIFGNTGIRALFDDATDVGRILNQDQIAAYLNSAKVQGALADIAVEYAGLLAASKDEVQGSTDGNTGHDKGALYFDASGSRLIGDFSRSLWSLQGSSVDIAGKKTLTDSVSTYASMNSSSSVSQAIETVWGGSTAQVIKMVAKTTDADGELKAREDAQIGQGEGAQPDDGAMLIGAGKKDVLFGYNGKDLLVGGAGNDTLIGGAGDDLMFGGSGDDTFQGYDDQHSAPDGTQDQTGYAGNDWIDGGSGNDTVDYSKRDATHQITLAEGPQDLNTGTSSIKVTDPTGGDDTLLSVERIRLSAEKDTVLLKGLFEQQGSQKTLIDMGGEPDGAKQDPSQGDKLDFSQYGTQFQHDIYMKPGSTPLGDGYELFTDLKLTHSTGLLFTNVEYIVASDGDDKVRINNVGEKASSLARSPDSGQVGAFAEPAGDTGTDTTGQLRINLGGGNDTLMTAPWGTMVDTGDGEDEIWFTDGIGITDLSAQDHLTIFHNINLFGALRYKWSESPWAVGLGSANKGIAHYGINDQGELAIEVDGLGTMYVLNWKDSTNLPFEDRPGHITLKEYESGAYHFIQKWPDHQTQMGVWDLMGAVVQTEWGTKVWHHSDPLTLDLDGNGLDLKYQSSVSPMFDMDGDGYAERSGWVGPADGFLVRDLNGNGKIDDSSEMFGGARSGFEALAVLDGNHDGKVDADDNDLADFNGDGVVDANDTIGSLLVWRDLNQDAVTQEGELFSLAQLGIASISVDAQTQDHVSINGNQVAKTATFTRIDGSTGTVADVWYSIDNIYTKYTGGPIAITAQAAALPEHHGYGTLVSLREAMSLSPDFATTVANTLPSLSPVNLNQLRHDAIPILTGWALASPLKDGDNDPNTQPTLLNTHRDMDVLVRDGAFGKDEVIDFAYRTSATVTDAQGHTSTVQYWALASGTQVTDAAGNVIEHPTRDQVLASPQTEGAWSTFEGALIAFAERYIGESLPLDKDMPEGTGAMSGFTDVFTNVLNTVDLAVVRIVTQGGPLAQYFTSLVYDATNNNFHAAPGNNHELIPVYEAIFDHAVATGADAGWIGSWKPILDIVIGDYVRGATYLLNTYGFIAQEIVAAYENSGLSLDFATVATSLGIPANLLHTGTGTLTGTDDADIFYAVGGGQVLQGGEGPDTYIFGRNIGHQVIDDTEGAGGGNQVPDTIRFAQLTPDDISAHRDGIDLILTVKATGETVTVAGQFTGHAPGLFGGNLLPDRGVGEIIFADGTVWDDTDIAKSVRDPQPTSDTVMGTNAVDYLDGGAGDDTLIGGNDGDHYFFDVGYGHDTVEDQQTNVLVDAPDMVIFGDGIKQDDVIFSRNGNSSDLEIDIAGHPNDHLTIVGQFDASYTLTFGTQWFNRIEAFAFATHAYVTWDDLLPQLVAQQETSGNDTVYGFSYADTLDGGAGDDFLSGGNENDTYIFGTGYGHDTIYEQATNILGGMTDTVRFTPDVRPEDVTFTREGDTNNLIVTLASGDTLRVINQFAASATGPFGTQWFDRIERFEFPSTGTVITPDQIMETIIAHEKTAGDDTIIGFWHEDVLDGGAGNDYLAGGAEGDTYIYGRGYDNDTIYDEANVLSDGDNVDKVVFNPDVAPSDIVLSRPADHLDNLVLTIADTGETLTIKDYFLHYASGASFNEIEQLRFADGTVWTPSDVRLQLLTQAKTAGDDNIYGFYTADVLDGGAGNDHLAGLGGGDTYVFGHGYGHDTVDAYIGYGTAPDTVAFKADVAPSDVHLARSNDDLIITLDGSGDQLTILDQFSYYGYSRVENFQFTNGTVWTWQDVQVTLLTQAGTPGDDTIIGYGTDDTLDGGAGNDFLQGGAGNDTYVFGRGYDRDTIDDGNNSVIGDAPDRVLFKDGVAVSDLEFVKVGDDDLVIRIVGTSDQLTIKHQFNPFYQISTFEFHDGTVLTMSDVQTILDNNPPGMVTHLGTAAAETIVGTGQADVIDGLGGDDVLQGGDGGDTYLHRAGSGNDRIEEGAYTNGDDVLKLVDANPADVRLLRSGNDLLVQIGPSGETVTVKDQFISGSSGIETIQFADATVWDRAAMANVLWLVGTGGNDTVDGTSGDDRIDGLGGDDLLRGGAGSDTYRYGAGSGNDTIDEPDYYAGTDVVQLAGLNASDVDFTRAGNDLVITVNATGERLTVTNQYNGASGIEQVTFADGTSWDRSQIAAATWTLGTSGNDTLYGTSGSDRFDGLGGDDYLAGGDGGDLYRFGVGSGNDTISESDYTTGTDVVVLKNLNVADVDFTRSQTHLYITVKATGERLTVEQQFNTNGSYGIEQVQFANGTIWDRAQIASATWLVGTSGDDTLYGTSAADNIDGLGGDDVLNGGNGGDTYRFGVGSGNDTINEADYDTGTDIVLLKGLNASDVFLGRSGNDLIITIDATGERLTVSNQFNGAIGIELVQFADGSTLNRSQIAASVWTVGTSGNDSIYGTTGNDKFDGLGGNDYIEDRGGSDTYRFGVGSGNDTIAETDSTTDVDTVLLSNLNASDVTFTHSGADLTISINSTGETVKVQNQFNGNGSYGIEQVQFADGSIWNRAQIQAAAWIRGTSGNDSLSGSSGPDVFFGGRGDDNLYDHAGGADTYIYASGDGNDTIDEQSGDASEIDVLKLLNVNPDGVTLSKDGIQLYITINATGQQIHDVDHFWANVRGIDQITFGDGTIWDRATIDAQAAAIHGTGGNDTINGTSGDDILDGGPGTDTLNGGAGNDTYIFATGYGTDTVNEWGWDAGTDTAKLVGLNASDVTFSRDGYDLYIKINATGDTLKATSEFKDNDGFDQVQFANGTVWNRSQITSAAWVRGTAGNDSISGTGDAETFDGGAGNDTISGGAGSDTYIFGVGSGNDTVNDWGWDAGTDTAKLVGLNASDVTFTRDGYDLTIKINSSGETLKASSQFRDNDGFDQVQFADGTVWSRSQITDAAWIRGTSGNDSISGTGDAEIFDAGAGNDTISGGAGSDTYIFGVGSGNDTVNDWGWDAGTDTARLVGLNASDVTFSRDGYDLTIKINSTGETLKATSEFRDNDGVDQVQFANGTVWNRSQITDAAWIRGTSGNDSISGTGDAETFDGGPGNDTISGGAGSDTYIFKVGSGNDTVNEWDWDAGTDTAKLLGLNSSDVSLSRVNNDLVITINSSGETLKASSQFSSGAHGFDQIQFADGTVWGRTAITQNTFTYGTSGNDTWTGTSGIDAYDGGAGNDTINGAGGDDSPRGGAGNDVLTGGAGNDIPDGGTGNDTAVFSGNYASYAITWNGTTAAVSGPDGNDTITTIGRLQFADKSVWLVGQGSGAEYTTVQSAVDAAAAGDVILIASGTYSESKIPNPYSSDAGGFYIDKANLTLQGTKADGSYVTSAAEAQASGPVIVSAHETGFGSNLFIGPDGTGTVLNGLHLQAGPETTNKLLEFWANNVTIEHNFIDTYVNGTDTGAAAIYINDAGTPITQYLIDGNILNEGIYVANGVGTAGQGIATTQVISNNVFGGSFDDVTGNGRYDMVAVQGQIPGVAWQLDPAQVPTVAGNDTLDNSAPFLFRMTEANASLFPSASEVASVLASNTDANTSYAYVLNSDGTLQLAERDIGSGPYKVLYVANDIDTLNAGFSAPNGIFGGARDTMDPGDTLVVQSVGHTERDIIVDNLTVKATASSADLDLTLSTGVHSLTLADYASGQGANVNVTGNNLGDTLVGNSGNNVLAGGTGNDILTGGAGQNTFVFKAGFGQDIVTDFKAGSDVVELHDGLFADAAAALAAATTSGSNTIIHVDAANFITLQNVAVADLHQNDFRVV